MARRYRIRDFDFKLLFLCLALAVFGIFMIGSAKESLQSRQILGVALGLGVMLFSAFVDYGLWLKMYWLLYAGNLFLLAMVRFFGAERGGAQRWLVLGEFTFQPSESAKILLILFFAQFIMKYKERLHSYGMLAVLSLLAFVPWMLVFSQPDLSTSMVILALFCGLVFLSGMKLRILATTLAVILPLGMILLALALRPESTLLEDFQKNRVLAFIDPEEYATTTAYQQINSVTAIASGQLDGKGYKNNEITSVKNGNFISEPQTDFIFSVVGEEFGFKGSLLVVGLLTAISLECLWVAGKAKDLAGSLIAAGMGVWVAVQSFFNIGVTTFLLPNTGLPLPFVSYGLTSLLALFGGMGIVLNVRLQASAKKDGGLGFF